MQRQNATPVVCITGATSGIGFELAKQYLNRAEVCPVRLVLIGRRPLSTLDRKIYGPDNYCCTDLREPASVPTVETWLNKQGIEKIDLFIHNAGTGYIGSLEEQSGDSICALLQVNLQTPLALTHALLPRLQGGTVCFVTSVMVAVPSPDFAVYSATKAALEGFARNLRVELNAPASRLRARVVLIRPGATRTEMHRKSGADLQEIGWERFSSPEGVASEILKTLNGGRCLNTIGFTNKLIAWGGQLLDGPVDRVLLKTHVRRQPKEEQRLHTSPAANSRPHCVITGAAAGIGRALVQHYLQQDFQVTGIDVDVEDAARVQSVLDPGGKRLSFLTGDLCSLTDLDRFEEALAQGPAIDLFIHNAGVGAAGYFAEMEWVCQERVLEVNLRAPLLLTAGILRRSLLKPGASLIFVASLSCYLGYPGAAVYAASKDGLASFARSLTVALAPRDIHVLTVFPGPTRTAHARRYSPDNSRETRRMPPEQLAVQIAMAAQRRQTRLVPGRGNQTAAVLGKCFPRLMDLVMRKLILDKL